MNEIILLYFNMIFFKLQIYIYNIPIVFYNCYGNLMVIIKKN